MWPRKRLDIGWDDLAFALRQCVTPSNQSIAAKDAETAFRDDGHSLVCLSVRSGFDLFLATADLPHGSEVLVSAITIPDMVRIIEHHGLVAVPIDVDPDTGVPTAADIVRGTTSNTRAVLIAHLFGAVVGLDKQIATAHAHELLFIEDCAQAYRGRGFTGHPAADLSMFSFGTIKRATALGGAIVRVRNRELLRRMRDRHAGYPVLSRYAYLHRVLKYTLLKLLETRPVYSVIVFLVRLTGNDHDRWVNSLVRGFPADQLFPLIRQRPAAALLKLLTRRQNGFDSRRERLRTARGRRLAEALHDAVGCPTAFEKRHGFWVFAISVDTPESIRRVLLDHGFDATQGQSMIVVRPPDDDRHEPTQALQLLPGLLLLPFYESLPNAALNRMARILRDHLEQRRELDLVPVPPQQTGQ